MNNIDTDQNQVESKTIEHDGVAMAYTVAGPAGATPVLLMHGWGCDHTTLVSIEKPLTPEFRVYNVDFPGFGRSTEPAEIWGVDRYASLIERLIEVEKIDRPVLLGHSFGGRVAIVLGARRDDIRKIILVDSAGVKPRRSLRRRISNSFYQLGKRLTRLLLPRDKAERIIAERAARRASADYRAASPMMRQILSRVVNEDLCDRMPAIKAPTLLVWGENDTATPLADARLMEKLIPGSGLVAFPGCGHYSFLDNPVQFKAVINSFLHS
ncbi:MAG: alpha/beta hydrolase [Clostridium sp.]|nr:alpha/beta hydrolase [Clostridium sp.]